MEDGARQSLGDGGNNQTGRGHRAVGDLGVFDRMTRGSPMGRVLWALAVCAVSVIVLGSCSEPQAEGGPSETGKKGAADCSLNSNLTSSCGALWGVNPPGHDYRGLRKSEKAVDGKFDFVYRFHDMDDRIPDNTDRQFLSHGRTMHITIDARDYSKSSDKALKWGEIASGAYDADLEAQAKGVASIKNPVFVTFDHEPDPPRKSRRGSASDYVAAWRHVHRIFEQAGADNVVWVWVVTGWIPSADTALRMWPGNSQVDWISWEAYDGSGCKSGSPDASRSESFGKVANKFLKYLNHQGPDAGIDVHKPMMISESGSAVAPDGRGHNWYQKIPEYLKEHQQIKAIGLWDKRGRERSCRFAFSSNRERAKDVSRAGRMKWVNPLGNR